MVGGQHFDVAGLDEAPEFRYELVGDGVTVSEPFLEQMQGFSEVHAGDRRHLDGVHRWRVVILAAASTAASMSSSPTSLNLSARVRARSWSSARRSWWCSKA